MNLDFSELQREIHKVHEKSLHEEPSGPSRKDVRDFKITAPDRVGAVNRYTMFFLPYLDSRGVPALGREIHNHFIVLGEQRVSRTCMERTVVNGTTKPCPFCYTIKSVANMTGNKDLRREIFSYSANGNVYVNILPWALNSQRYNFSQNPGDGLPPYLPHVLRIPLKLYNKVFGSIAEVFPTPPMPFDPLSSNAVMIEVEKKGTRKMNIGYNASWAPNLRQALVPAEHLDAFLSQCYKLDEIYKAASDEQYTQQAEEAKIFAQHLHGILGGGAAPAAAPQYGQPTAAPTFAPAPTQAYVMAPVPAPTLTVPQFNPQPTPQFNPAPAAAPQFNPAPAAPVYQQPAPAAAPAYQPPPQAPVYQQPAPAAPVYQQPVQAPQYAAPAYQPPAAAPVYQPPQQQYEQPQQATWAPPPAAPAPLVSAPSIVPPAMAAFAPPSIAPTGQPTQTNTMPEGAGAPSSPSPFAPPPAQGFQQG